MAAKITESILGSIKKLLGSDEYFDPDLIIHINSVFSILQQIGVGPDDGYYIESDKETWDEFTEDEAILNMVKTYVYLRVKILFDSASDSSYLIDAYKKQADEIEWRLSVVDKSENGGGQ